MRWDLLEEIANVVVHAGAMGGGSILSTRRIMVVVWGVSRGHFVVLADLARSIYLIAMQFDLPEIVRDPVSNVLPAFLGAAVFGQAASAMTLGQMSEIMLMLLIPFFFRRLGVKWMLLMGMLCWFARYFLFAFGAPDQVTWMLLMGMFFGFRMAFCGAGPFTAKGPPNTWAGFGAVPEGHAELIDTIAENSDRATFSCSESLLGRFGKDYPEGVPAGLISKAMNERKGNWIFLGGLAAVIALIFFLCFWDKSAEESEPK